MSLVYVIEDDPTMADVIALAARSTVLFDKNGQEVHPGVRVFNDAVEPISEMNEKLPDVILLDVLLSGPDGFTFLNELISYHDTAKIPVVLISSIDFSDRNLEHYGVIHTLDKSKMTPEDIREAVLKGIEKNLSATEAGIQKLNQQLRQVEKEQAFPSVNQAQAQSQNDLLVVPKDAATLTKKSATTEPNNPKVDNASNPENHAI